MINLTLDRVDRQPRIEGMKPMSTRDAAKILEVSERTIFRLIERELIKAEKFGNYWSIDPASVEAYKETIKGKSKFDPTRGKVD